MGRDADFADSGDAFEVDEQFLREEAGAHPELVHVPTHRIIMPALPVEDVLDVELLVIRCARYYLHSYLNLLIV